MDIMLPIETSFLNVSRDHISNDTCLLPLALSILNPVCGNATDNWDLSHPPCEITFSRLMLVIR